MSRPKKKWRCFFCDEVFTDSKKAGEHFGSDEYEAIPVPGCVDPLRFDEKERLNQLHDAERYALQCQSDLEDERMKA